VGRVSLGALDFKALGAGPQITQAALPGAREEAVTARGGTAANELGGDGSARRTAHGHLVSPRPHILHSVPEGSSFSRNGVELFVAFPIELVVPFLDGGIFPFQ